MGKTRILTPEGEIIQILMHSPHTPLEIAEKAKTSRASIYNNLKDLLLAGWVVREDDSYRVTGAGVKAYFSEVLPGVDAGALLVFSRAVGIDPLRFVGLGVRLLNALVNAAYLPGDLVRLLGHNDPALLEVLTDIFGRRDGGDMAQAAEVVA